MIRTARLRRAVRRETIGVDVGAALNLVGALAKYLSLAFAFPIAFALGYGEPLWPFAAAAALTASFGIVLERLTAGKEHVGPREGFLVVALMWLLAAMVGALPYVLAGEGVLGHPVNAFFEGMSGFTTTGASTVVDPSVLSDSMLMWRQLTQWLGGAGIIVLALAVLPRLRVGGRQLFESESPGPEIEQLTASIRDTARRLWLLYVALTGLLLAALLAVGYAGLDDRLGPFEALAHALTTMPTGGFSTEERSVAEFAPVTQWIIIAFMVVAGVNFALLFAAIVRRRVRKLATDEELRVYLVLLTLGAVVLLAELVRSDLHQGREAVRHAAFQSVAAMTGTGYASTDYVVWPSLALVTLVGLMFIGGSAGSTTGSVKVVRHLLIGRILRRELDQTVHPELVAPIRLNRVPVDERAVRAVIAFVLLYMGIFVAGSLGIALDSALNDIRVSPFEAVAAAAATLGNVGPATGFAGPLGSYEPFSDFSKLIMCGLMWLGRVEIIPVIVLFTKVYWRA